MNCDVCLPTPAQGLRFARVRSSRAAGIDRYTRRCCSHGTPDPQCLWRGRNAPSITVRGFLRAMPVRIVGLPALHRAVYSDHFSRYAADRRPVGYKLESPPLHPILTATTLPDDGVGHAQWMRDFRNMHVVIALLRDGFNAGSIGGHRASAGRRDAGARLSARAALVGRRTPRATVDGGDPVRRGCHAT
jgi:hypothetical protein